MKLLGVKYWGILIPYKIQLGDVSMGGGADGILHNMQRGVQRLG